MADRRRLPWLAVLPLAIFAAMAGIFLVGLYRENPNDLPSAFAGKSVPQFQVQDIAGLTPFDPGDLKKPQVKLVNFWASWCGPCRIEHDFLMELAAEGIAIHGINHKDRPSNAIGFLNELGNPYVSVGADANGRASFDWGVYGIPETFVINSAGQVIFRHPGPITPQVVEAKLRPAIAAAQKQEASDS